MPRHHSKEPGVIKLATMLGLIAIIVVKTIAALLKIVVNTIEGVREARQPRR